jgi:hypothetical protein
MSAIDEENKVLQDWSSNLTDTFNVQAQPWVLSDRYFSAEILYKYWKKS